LSPLRAQTDRIFDITVCLRPFRAAGPRLDTEQIGDAFVVHNYGHGGSGWSLSWGSSTIAVQKAMAGSPRHVAVIGCGALGLTSAILAQRAGAKVTIYAREFLPETRSARATGSWSPDSRIALSDDAGPGFAAVWEQMARTSFESYRTQLGLPGNPVECSESYAVLDQPIEDARARDKTPDPLGFGSYHGAIEDLTPGWQLAPAGSTPFDAPYVYRAGSLTFHIADYGRMLMSDFLAAGGEMRRMEFHSPAELTGLNEKVVINCPGYGARALWQDASITPVRGQIAWLPAQPELSYSVHYNNIYMLARRGGIVVQAVGDGDLNGYGDEDETPDRAEAEVAVKTLAQFYSRFRAPSRV
jgi:D-amino-acid oxidase